MRISGALQPTTRERCVNPILSEQAVGGILLSWVMKEQKRLSVGVN